MPFVQNSHQHDFLGSQRLLIRCHVVSQHLNLNQILGHPQTACDLELSLLASKLTGELWYLVEILDLDRLSAGRGFP